MEPNVFDNVRFEKEKAMARFNRFRTIEKLWRIFEFVMVLGLISWCLSRVPVVIRVSGIYFLDFTTCLFNHHVVFLIGNVIVASLFMLCRQNAADNLPKSKESYYEYVKHSEAAAVHPGAERAERGDKKKQIKVVEEIKLILQCDVVAVASRRTKKLQRTQSEKLNKQEILVKPRSELQRSQTENCGKIVDCSVRGAESEIETQSNEEFQQTVDDFIDKHRSNRKQIMMNY